MTTADIVADVAQTHPITVLKIDGERLSMCCGHECDPNHETTRALQLAGVAHISHGYCEAHLAIWLAKADEYHAKKLSAA